MRMIYDTIRELLLPLSISYVFEFRGKTFSGHCTVLSVVPK